jgi:hypothetical protein
MRHICRSSGASEEEKATGCYDPKAYPRKEALSRSGGPSILATVSTGRGVSIRQPFCRNCMDGRAAAEGVSAIAWGPAIAARHSLALVAWTAMGHCPLSPISPEAQSRLSIVHCAGFAPLSLSAHDN